MARSIGRYSGYIRPAIYVVDVVIVLLLAKLSLDLGADYMMFGIYIFIAWVLLSLQTKFYAVYRYTKPGGILSLVILQMAVFSLVVFAFYGLWQELRLAPKYIFRYIVYVFVAISIVKFGVFYLLKAYRSALGGNWRSVVILGANEQTTQLEEFFGDNKEYGYNVKRVFDLHKDDVSFEDMYTYILQNKIDEIYCSVAQFTNEELREISEFTDNNLKILKFIPDNREIFTKKLEYQYLGITPILSLRDIPIDKPLNQFIKRTFDIIMSLVVLIGLLSWLTPILAIMIRLDSKGPVFFKQKRNGLDYHEFYCYKFRSMRPNKRAHLNQVSRNDERITWIGKFLRKTSMDELPQFINVLKGDMSVVGPRPHMVSHTHMYAERIDKFMVRHFIKPGITGLAQVSGYRGEVETDDDIINRVKFDIYYVENWSLFLDIKIVLKTIVKAIGGDEKAY